MQTFVQGDSVMFAFNQGIHIGRIYELKNNEAIIEFNYNNLNGLVQKQLHELSLVKTNKSLKLAENLSKNL